MLQRRQRGRVRVRAPGRRVLLAPPPPRRHQQQLPPPRHRRRLRVSRRRPRSCCCADPGWKKDKFHVSFPRLLIPWKRADGHSALGVSLASPHSLVLLLLSLLLLWGVTGHRRHDIPSHLILIPQRDTAPRPSWSLEIADPPVSVPSCVPPNPTNGSMLRPPVGAPSPVRAYGFQPSLFSMVLGSEQNGRCASVAKASPVRPTILERLVFGWDAGSRRK